MQKLIVTPEECGEFLAPWYDLKSWRLKDVPESLRESEVTPGENVLNYFPLLLVPSEEHQPFFTLFDHHAAYRAYSLGLNSDAIIVETLDDLDGVGDSYFIAARVSKDALADRFRNMNANIGNCQSNGIRTIGDLAHKYSPETGIRPVLYRVP